MLHKEKHIFLTNKKGTKKDSKLFFFSQNFNYIPLSSRGEEPFHKRIIQAEQNKKQREQERKKEKRSNLYWISPIYFTIFISSSNSSCLYNLISSSSYLTLAQSRFATFCMFLFEEAATEPAGWRTAVSGIMGSTSYVLNC